MSRMPDVGDMVDDVFRVEAELDQGSFGAIYRVRDVVEDQTLALKLQKPGPHDEQEVRQRFEREARLIYSLNHQNIVQVMYFGQTDEGLPYMAMEFLDGTDLKRLVRGGYELQDDQIKRITLETLSALQAAHRIGIVHRDLKPANIFLVDDGDRGHVKVLDFGFAKALDNQNNQDITRAGTLVGSPAYMAPEMVHKENVGPHSDLYAMGLIMAEMIAGQKVVQIENIYDTIMFQGSDDPVDLPDAIPESPFARVVRRAVRKDIGDRYASAEEMMNDLEQADLQDGTANLQSHAEVTTSASAPFVLGSADEDAETVPRSHGMPSVDQVDDTLQRDTPSGSGPPVDPGADAIVSGSTRTEEWDRSSGALADIANASPDDQRRQTSGGIDAVDGDRRRTSGGMEAVEPSNQRRSTGPIDAVDRDSRRRNATEQNRPVTGRQDALDMDRPTSSADRNNSGGGSSLLVEIGLGVLLGTVGLAIILGVLLYMR